MDYKILGQTGGPLMLGNWQTGLRSLNSGSSSSLKGAISGGLYMVSIVGLLKGDSWSLDYDFCSWNMI